MDQKLYDSYVKILKNELVPALGCTEPIALAYCAAKAREVLGSKSTRSTRTDAGIDRALLQWKHHQKRKGC